MRSDSTMPVRCAVILAGGLGTRLRAAVPGLPKPMAPLNGRPFLAHLMDYWCGQGVMRFVLSVGYLHEKIQSAFGTSYRGAAIEYAIEETPLGTGGGLRLAIQRLEDVCPFWLLNGDTLFTVQAGALRHFHNERNADCSMALFRAAEADRYMSVSLGTHGRVAALAGERAEIGGLANGGVYLLHPDMLYRFPVGAPLSFEHDMLPQCHAAGATVCGMECEGSFIDIGLPADYARAPEIVARQRHGLQLQNEEAL